MKPSIRHAIRVCILLAVAACALQIVPWRETARLLPGLSPLLSIGGAVAARRLTLAALLGLPIMILALFRGRWFCVHVCPTGHLAEGISHLRPRACSRFTRLPPVGRWLAGASVGAAIAGYPLIIWLDPLSMFNGFFGAWHLPLKWLSLAPAAGLTLILLVSFLWPHSWCRRFCPLGAVQDSLGMTGKRLRTRRPRAADAETDAGRRTFLTLLLGGAVSLAVRPLVRAAPELPIRPPGSAAEGLFLTLCARCGNCIKACPGRIIKPDLGRSGPAGLFTPVIVYSGNPCDAACNECNKVCPTGAIQPLRLEAKRDVSIGLARVTRSRCLAWSGEQYCLACQPSCPYAAIRDEEHNGIPCPVVDSTICRGCGACQNHCPAVPMQAIVVHGIVQKAARVFVPRT